MNFLALCKRVRQDAGVSGDGPSSVTGQTDILARIVTWTKNADEQLQLKNEDWRFLWAYGSGPTVAGRAEYHPADLGLSSPRTLSNVVINGEPLESQSWEWYLHNVLSEGRESEQGTPKIFVMRPDNKIMLWPTPNAVFTVHTDYYKRPVALVNGTDEPLIPSEFHEAIVCRALMFYAHYEEDTYLFQTKLVELNEWLSLMGQSQKPSLRFG